MTSLAPSVPVAVAAAPPAKLSVRAQKLKTHSDRLAQGCAHTVHSSLSRHEHNLALTGALTAHTLQSAQQAAASMQLANSNLEKALPMIEVLCRNNNLPAVKSL